MIMRDPAKSVIKRDKLIHCRVVYSHTCVIAVFWMKKIMKILFVGWPLYRIIPANLFMSDYLFFEVLHSIIGHAKQSICFDVKMRSLMWANSRRNRFRFPEKYLALNQAWNARIKFLNTFFWKASRKNCCGETEKLWTLKWTKLHSAARHMNSESRLPNASEKKLFQINKNMLRNRISHWREGITASVAAWEGLETQCSVHGCLHNASQREDTKMLVASEFVGYATRLAVGQHEKQTTFGCAEKSRTCFLSDLWFVYLVLIDWWLFTRADFTHKQQWRKTRGEESVIGRRLCQFSFNLLSINHS